MDKVLQTVALGIAALATPWVVRSYESPSKTPFADDRKRLYGDYTNIKRDLEASLQKARSQNGTTSNRG